MLDGELGIEAPDAYKVQPKTLNPNSDKQTFSRHVAHVGFCITAMGVQPPKP